MKLITYSIFLIFCLNIYSAHAGITGTPTPQSAKTTSSNTDKDSNDDNNQENNKTDEKH